MVLLQKSYLLLTRFDVYQGYLATPHHNLTHSSMSLAIVCLEQLHPYIYIFDEMVMLALNVRKSKGRVTKIGAIDSNSQFICAEIEETVSVEQKKNRISKRIKSGNLGNHNDKQKLRKQKENCRNGKSVREKWPV